MRRYSVQIRVGLLNAFLVKESNHLSSFKNKILLSCGVIPGECQRKGSERLGGNSFLALWYTNRGSKDANYRATRYSLYSNEAWTFSARNNGFVYIYYDYYFILWETLLTFHLMVWHFKVPAEMIDGHSDREEWTLPNNVHQRQSLIFAWYQLIYNREYLLQDLDW